jgi:programmed cell death 6-interacting protein
MKHLQLASGLFTHLKDSVVGLIQQDPTPDLEPETLGVLGELMLAQAQEMVVVKSLKDRMKPGIVAKLCSQCEELYATVMRSMQRESVRNVWDHSWLPNVCGKQGRDSPIFKNDF